MPPKAGYDISACNSTAADAACLESHEFRKSRRAEAAALSRPNLGAQDFCLVSCLAGFEPASAPFQCGSDGALARKKECPEKQREAVSIFFKQHVKSFQAEPLKSSRQLLWHCADLRACELPCRRASGGTWP